ncbi:MAG: serine hydroxymethyltransferase, partial [Thermodesulfobacteriota bacterium]
VAFKEALSPEFKEYQEQIVKNAKHLGECMLEHSFNLVSGGTDNHLVLVDLREADLTGKLAEDTLEKAGITVNKNAIPFDPHPPMVTSGIRIGTPAITTRGMKEEEMEVIAGFIKEALDNTENDIVLQRIKDDVRELCSKFPMYSHRLV